MANCKGDLRESLKTPEEKAVEQAQREAEAVAARNAVADSTRMATRHPSLLPHTTSAATSSPATTRT
jgi:hypothetical protein